MKAFYAKSEGRVEEIHIFSSRSDRDNYCRKTPTVGPITRKMYDYLVSHASDRGGAYTVHDHR